MRPAVTEEIDSQSIRELATAIDRLLEEDVDAHRDATSIRWLVQQHTRLESVISSSVAAFDASGDWALYGAKTSSAWIARTCRLPKAMARRIVRRGRNLRHLPVAEKAFQSGEINAAHIDAVVDVRR